MERNGRPPLRGDEAELFLNFNPQLQRQLRRDVNTSLENIEDACAFAWAQFLRHQPDRERNWQGWLYRVAQHEAWTLHEHNSGHSAFLQHDDDRPESRHASSRDAWDAYTERRELAEAVGILHELPPRLRQVAFMRATGFRYGDIAEVTGDSLTTVSRLVRRANERIYHTIAESQRAELPSHPRVQRLHEYEQNPPRWLTAAIGRPPRRSLATAVLAWRRAALLIADYRAEYGLRDPHDAIGRRPADPDAARAHTLVQAAIDRVREAREIGQWRSRGR